MTDQVVLTHCSACRYYITPAKGMMHACGHATKCPRYKMNPDAVCECYSTEASNRGPSGQIVRRDCPLHGESNHESPTKGITNG